MTAIFHVFANILVRRQYFMILLDFVAANICVYFQYLFMHFCICIFVIVIWSIVIIINSVLTLQVSTASLPNDREPCEIKVVSNHTCSLHTCVCAGSRRRRVRLSGFQRQGIGSLLWISQVTLFWSGSVPNTQEWEFFWLQFWNLYFFVDSYA